jgi:hypothetical protein
MRCSVKVTLYFHIAEMMFFFQKIRAARSRRHLDLDPLRKTGAEGRAAASNELE